MLQISKDRYFSQEISESYGEESIQHSVARIYGRPDDMVADGDTQTWYYFQEKVAFLFCRNSIEKVFELEPRPV